jgi:hypothetical protein
VFREVPLLMRVGVIMMAFALALVAAAAVVSAALRSEPQRLVPAEEIAAKSPGQAPRTSSGEEVSAIEKLSSEKESSHYWNYPEVADSFLLRHRNPHHCSLFIIRGAQVA